MKSTCNYYIVVSLLLGIVLSQGGGGSSGGGGGSSSGGSSYGGSNGGDGGQSCSEKCSTGTEQEKNACIDDCETTQEMVVAIVIPCVFGVPLIVGLAIYIFMNRDRLKYCCRDLREEQRIAFLKTIERSQIDESYLNTKLFTTQQTISFSQLFTTYNSENLQVAGRLNKNLNQIDFRMTGKDKFGDFQSLGILVKDREKIIYLWMAKDYNDKDKAGQTEQWTDLIYYGQQDIETQQFKGKWYYIGFENDNKYSGQWTMIANTMIANTEDELINNKYQ